MIHGFVLYIPHIPLTHLLLPLVQAKTLIAAVQHALQLPSTVFISHVTVTAFSLPSPPTVCRVPPAPHPRFSSWPGKGQSGLQLAHRNVQAGTRRLLKAIAPGMPAARAIPNPPSHPANTSRVSFLYVSAKHQISYWNLRLIAFHQTWLNLVNRFQSFCRGQTSSKTFLIKLIQFYEKYLEINNWIHFSTHYIWKQGNNGDICLD